MANGSERRETITTSQFTSARACVGLYSRHQHTSAQSSNQWHDGVLNAGSGGSHTRAHMRAPQPWQPLCLPLSQCLQQLQYMPFFSARPCSKTADRSICLYASNNKSSSATSSAASSQICTRSLGQASADVGATSKITLDTAVETFHRKLQGRQQHATPEQIMSLRPPPPPPSAIPIPKAAAVQLTPLTQQPRALTNSGQQYSGVLVSSHAPQQFLPQQLGGSQQGIPPWRQTDSTSGFDG